MAISPSPEGACLIICTEESFIFGDEIFNQRIIDY